MKTSRLFRIIAGLCIGLMTLASCNDLNEVDINNDNYELFFYSYVPKSPNIIDGKLSKDQEKIFQLVCDVYSERLKTTPGFMASKEEGYFKIQGKKLMEAVEVVNSHFSDIQKDLDDISQKVGYDIMTNINFAFVVQFGYMASDKSVFAFYSKTYGEEYFIYDPSLQY